MAWSKIRLRLICKTMMRCNATLQVPTSKKCRFYSSNYLQCNLFDYMMCVKTMRVFVNWKFAIFRGFLCVATIPTFKVIDCRLIVACVETQQPLHKKWQRVLVNLSAGTWPGSRGYVVDWLQGLAGCLVARCTRDIKLFISHDWRHTPTLLGCG